MAIENLNILIDLFVLSFLITLFALPLWIKRAKRTGFVGKDINKGGTEVAEMGGMAVILGSMICILIYIGLLVFVMKTDSLQVPLAAITVILIAFIIGMTDDVLGWQMGLSQREKVFLTLFIPIPLMAINAGHSMMTLPFLGKIDLGLLYPLLIVPLGIIGATNAFNMLAGYNGLEAGMGVIILSALGYLSWQEGSVHAAVIAFCLVGALIAFLLFNKFPAKVFPGDALTYPIGASIAVVAIIGNLESYAVLMFIPYFFEFLLKVKGRFGSNYVAVKVLEDGSLATRGFRTSLPHLAIDILRKIKGKAVENEVVGIILGAELLLALIIVNTYFIR